MTKKHIWAKLLIVALIVAMVCAFFIGCKKDEACTEHVDANGDGKCDKCGADMGGDEDDEEEEEIDTTAVDALLDVVDKAIAELAKVENVGTLGTDAFVEVNVKSGEKTTKVRIDLDLSLDLLNEATAGEAYSEYANNGFGFTVSVDDKQEFGLWYLNGNSEQYQAVYLAAAGRYLKIDALTLSDVLENYNVNASVATNGKLNVSLKDLAGSYAPMIAELVKIDYKTEGNNKVFSLNIKELFNPEGELCALLDTFLFAGEKSGLVDLAKILKEANVNITSTAALYNIIPEISLVLTGNFDSSNNFESIGLGLDIKGQQITVPVVEGDPIVVEAFPDTNVSAKLGFEILTNNDAFTNVETAVNKVINDNDWNDIGVLNFSAEATLKIGNSAQNPAEYKVEISADINAAAIANAVFTKRVYYKDKTTGAYVKNADGSYKYTDWFYLKGASMFEGSTDVDVLTALLPAINNLYVCVQNTKQADDQLVIALKDKVGVAASGKLSGGSVFIKLNALNNILGTFGLELDQLLGDAASLFNEMEGTVESFGDLIGNAIPTIADMIYKIPEGQTTTMTAPADFEKVNQEAAAAKEEADKEAAADKEEGNTENKDDASPDVMTVVMDVINKVMNALTINSNDKSITAKGEGEDYVIKTKDNTYGLTFDLTASVADGITLVTNEPFVLNENNGQVVTNFTADLAVGGTGNLFKAEVIVDQTKKVIDEETQEEVEKKLNIYIYLDLLKVGYGCAPTEPIAIQTKEEGDSEIFVARTGSLYIDGVGFVASKTAE